MTIVMVVNAFINRRESIGYEIQDLGFQISLKNSIKS